MNFTYKKLSFFAICLSPAVVLAQLPANQLQLNTITTAVPLLMVSPDAKAASLGDAGGAMEADANSIHWGAAKLASAKDKMSISLSYVPWLRALVPDINLAYLSFYKKLKKDQAFGGSLRYFSLGNIVFTDNQGNTIGQFSPNELAIDGAYSRKLTDRWYGGFAMRYIYSNLTGGIDVQGTQSNAGQSVAGDISAYYENTDIRIKGNKAVYALMIAATNIGQKISYTSLANRDFIPTNLRIGNRLKIQTDEYSSFSFLFDINKLLVPTPPVRDNNGNVLFGMENQVSVVQGIFQSFWDAPGLIRTGTTERGSRGAEEWKEVNLCGGFEYDYNNTFAIRAGYFHEAPQKGNRRFVTLGAGLKFNVFKLDFSYLIPVQQRNPLENTLRFTLHFNFANADASNKN